MYLVSAWGEGRCEKDKHRHIIWIDGGKACFQVEKVHVQNTDRVEYCVEMAGVDSGLRYNDTDEIMTVDTLEEAYDLIEDILHKSCLKNNTYLFYDCVTKTVVYHLDECFWG